MAGWTPREIEILRSRNQPVNAALHFEAVKHLSRYRDLVNFRVPKHMSAECEMQVVEP